MKSYKTTILGDEWSFVHCDADEYAKIEPENNSDAMTDFKLKKVLIKDLSKGTIRHELTHCYYSYLCLDSTNAVSPRDHEEIAAEFIDKYGERLVKQANQIYNKLKEKT